MRVDGFQTSTRAVPTVSPPQVDDAPGGQVDYSIVRRLFPMRNLKLTLAYDGTSFHGWQIQPGVPTIQGELERVIACILDHEITTHGSGRTDAGVHAHGQVAHFQTEKAIDTDALHRSVNALLQPDIRVMSIEEVPLEFHARESARAKTYEYHLWRSPVVSPFHFRYVHSIWQSLDADKVDRATAHFPGQHDFTSFSAASTSTKSHTREVYAAQWERSGEEWVFRIRASGFLQYMVRTIVGTLVEVGREKMTPEEIPGIFEARDRQLSGPSAPAKGLHLVSVEY